jgi:hypothetical protein
VVGARTLLVVAAAGGCGRVDFDVLPPDAVPGIQACSHPPATDDFDDSVASPMWNVLQDVGVTLQETGGQLVITLPTTAGDHYGGYQMMSAGDLRDQCVFVTVAGTPDGSALAETVFLIAEPTQHVGFAIEHNDLEAYINPGAFTVLSMVPYDPIAHRILRLREVSGELLWEASPDLSTPFTLVFSEPTPFDFSAVTFGLLAGAYGANAAPGVARFDDLNIP